MGPIPPTGVVGKGVKPVKNMIPTVIEQASVWIAHRPTGGYQMIGRTKGARFKRSDTAFIALSIFSGRNILLCGFNEPRNKKFMIAKRAILGSKLLLIVAMRVYPLTGKDGFCVFSNIKNNFLICGSEKASDQVYCLFRFVVWRRRDSFANKIFNVYITPKHPCG